MFFKLVRYSETLQYINVTEADPFHHLQESIPSVQMESQHFSGDSYLSTARHTTKLDTTRQQGGLIFHTQGPITSPLSPCLTGWA